MTEDKPLDRGPIFIGGPARSGKTYMRLMLSSHPDIVITRRTNMWPKFFHKFGDLRRAGNFVRCLDAMMSHKHIRYLEPDPDRLRRDFWQEPPTYARLFALIHEHYAQRLGKRRWGDQTEMIERFADPIYANYPNARIIHMIRDPRDRYEASLARRPRGRGRIGEDTSRWLYSLFLAKRNYRKYPDSYKIVHYEAMISQPEETLRQVCTFLDEEYTPSMLTLADVPRFRRKLKPGVKPGQSPLSTDYIGRYRQVLSKAEIAFIQTFSRREMLSLGYPLESIQLSANEKVKSYLLDWPVYLVRMFAWYILRTSLGLPSSATIAAILNNYHIR